MNFVSDFRSDLELRQLRKHTIENYVSDVQHFLRYNPNPCRVTKGDLQEYLQILLDKDLTASTLKSYLPRRSSQEKRQDIQVDTARTIIRRAGHILDKSIHLLLAKTGIRREELRILKDEDLILDDWLIKAPLTGKRLDFRPIYLDEETILKHSLTKQMFLK